MELVTQTVKVDVHCSKSPRETTAENGNGEDKRDKADIIDADCNGFDHDAEKENDADKDKLVGVGGDIQDSGRLPDWDHTSELTPTPQYSSETERHGSPVRRHHSQPRVQASVHPYSQIPSEFVHHQNHHYQQHQARIYRPRVVQHSQHNPQQVVAQHQKRSLARYITGSGHNSKHSALPSRGTMVYSPTPFVTAGEGEGDKSSRASRPRKRGVAQSATASSKMRQLRNRSQSPHAVHLQDSHSRDREFLRAIQNSVERRQRAHRLSLYQLPDQDDDAWNIG